MVACFIGVLEIKLSLLKNPQEPDSIQCINYSGGAEGTSVAIQG